MDESARMSWEESDAYNKAANLHGLVAILYGIPTALIGLAVVGLAITHRLQWTAVVLLAILGLLLLSHLKTKAALEQGKRGGIAASAVLALPLLLAFPIGTLLGIWMFVRISKITALLPREDERDFPVG